MASRGEAMQRPGGLRAVENRWYRALLAVVDELDAKLVDPKKAGEAGKTDDLTKAARELRSYAYKRLAEVDGSKDRLKAKKRAEFGRFL